MLDTALIKVGQHPSFADFHSEDVKSYRGTLPRQQLAEFTRAINLAAHDVGIGAYVYLRRVFEWLVEEVSTSINTTAAGGNASLMAMT